MSEVKKSRYAILILVLVMCLTYKYLIAPSISFYQKSNQLVSLTDQYGDITTDLNSNLALNFQLNQILSDLSKDPIDIQKKISRFFTKNQNIRLVSLSQPLEQNRGTYTIFVYKAIFEAQYNDALYFLHQLERVKLGAKMKSVEISTTDSGRLRLFIHLISYKNEKM